MVQESAHESGGPPMQLQSSSHSVETSQDRSAGNIKLGKTPYDPGRSCARWRPAPAPPLPARNAIWNTTSPSAHRETQCRLRRCRDSQATTAGLASARSQRRHGQVTVFPLFVAVRQHDRGVGVEDRRDGSGDGPAHGRAVGDPRDLSVVPDPPGPAVPGQPDRQHGGRRRRFGIRTWPRQRRWARLLGSHATSLDPPGTPRAKPLPWPRNPRQPTGPAGRPLRSC